MSGVFLATQDKKQEKKRNLSGLSDDFVRGYKTVGQPGWWEKVNNALSNFLSQFGKSIGDKRIWR